MTDKKTKKPEPQAHPYGPSPNDEIKKHGGALSGAVIGGAAGSFIPVIGTIGGAIVGAVVGHLNDQKRYNQVVVTQAPAPQAPPPAQPAPAPAKAPAPEPKKRPF